LHPNVIDVNEVFMLFNGIELFIVIDGDGYGPVPEWRRI
jgi:hypothetical protein